MNIKEYAVSVVSRQLNSPASDGVSIIDIASIIAIVLPILSNLPCLVNRSSEGKREFVENHTQLAIMQTTQEIRKQARGNGEKLVRREARSYATTIIEDYLSTPDTEIMAMGIFL